MESKICPGLYFAGEILDVDGFTGGFNLQAAWATGHLAGEGVCRSCQQVFMSVYETEPNDQHSNEAWNVYYYYLPESLQQDLLINATLCGAPDNATCNCAMHQLISELDFSQLQRLP